MLSSLRRITRSKFVRNVAIVASGTAAAQAITIAFAPIITRLYGPEAFGLLGSFIAVCAIITPVAALAYPMAIVLPAKDSDAKGVARLSAYISIGVAGATLLVVAIGGERLLTLLQAETIAGYAYLIPLNLLFAALLQIAQQWLIRKKYFHIKAKIAVLQALFVNGAKTGFGFINPVGATLIVLTTIGGLVHTAMVYFAVIRAKAEKKRLVDNNLGVDQTPLLSIAKEHRDFPCYRAPQLFINAVSHNLPVLMLAGFFGPAAAGFYTLGKRILALPSQLIANSVGDVFYPRIAEAARNGEKITGVIVKATLALAGVGFAPAFVVFVFGPKLFGFVFGSEWAVAGEYARWLVLWTYFMFLNGPSVKALPVISGLKFFLYYTIIMLALRILSIAAGYYLFGSDICAIIFYSMVGAAVNITLIIIILFKSAQYDRANSLASL